MHIPKNFTFRCPSCAGQLTLDVKDIKPGKKINCSACDFELELPPEFAKEINAMVVSMLFLTEPEEFDGVKYKAVGSLIVWLEYDAEKGKGKDKSALLLTLCQKHEILPEKLELAVFINPQNPKLPPTPHICPLKWEAAHKNFSYSNLTPIPYEFFHETLKSHLI
ncbi:hypothetical protein Ctha_0324 [Chloroherpeton thalassium ATCC 35110]|uniref:Uncharacterized protein n=1 Tax=Chloroherpeton thalassium (strain ATCC 35110 / GB-78) TaxID=517418 RepID=B3QTZ7_CHLT3|nr:hypothetical protein [Chloroherpeton thalassium]ACF12795.1 hypothetical protein Ctha_0324 [Chloroherpeton thalassium ATCC 35110]